MRWLTLALIGSAMLAPTASAQEIKQMDIVDFLVDWQDYVGKPVLVTGGSVNGASPDYAGLSAMAGIVTLKPPWLDKEDLRFILKNCAGFGMMSRCKMVVGGTVQPSFGDGPSLTSVDFIIPQ